MYLPLTVEGEDVLAGGTAHCDLHYSPLYTLASDKKDLTHTGRVPLPPSPPRLLRLCRAIISPAPPSLSLCPPPHHRTRTTIVCFFTDRTTNAESPGLPANAPATDLPLAAALPFACTHPSPSDAIPQAGSTVPGYLCFFACITGRSCLLPSLSRKQLERGGSSLIITRQRPLPVVVFSLSPGARAWYSLSYGR